MIRVDGQLGDDIPQILAIGELPGTGEGNDKERTFSITPGKV